MDRRSFLKFLAAIPVIKHVPLPKRIFGSGHDGDITLTDKAMVSPYQWERYGGMGGGGGGGYIIVFNRTSMNVNMVITANGGNKDNTERHA